MFADFHVEQPWLAVTVTFKADKPAAPAVNVIVLIPAPAVIVALVLVHV